MAEVTTPTLYAKYHDEGAFSQVVVTDPSVGLLRPPDGYVMRVFCFWGFYQQDGSANPVDCQLDLVTGYEDAINGNPIICPPVMVHVVGGFITVIYSRDVTSGYNIQHQPGFDFRRISYNPLPNVTIGPEGHVGFGFINCDRLQPDTYHVEYFPAEGKSGTFQYDAATYLLPAGV